MAAKVLRCCCVWLLLVAEVARCEVHRVQWTAEGVELYRNNPLVVHLSDTLPESDKLILQCVPGNFSNILEVSSRQEFDSCDSSSSGQATSVGECHGTSQEIRYPITQNSGNLDGVVDFRVGVTVYFASYSDGRGLLSVTSNLTRGGQCLMGLKLAVRVVDPTATTPPPTTAAPTTTAPPSTATPTTSQSNSQSTIAHTHQTCLLYTSPSPRD